MKNIYVFLVLTTIFSSISAGLAPGLDANKKKIIVKNQPITAEVGAPLAESFVSEDAQTTAPSSGTDRTNGSNLSSNLSHTAKTITGKTIGGWAAKKNLIKNAWKAGKLMKQHAGKKGFIRISITIFVFLTLLFLIGMFIGTLIYLDTKLLFFIALALLLLWVLLFVLGNLGIRKR